MFRGAVFSGHGVYRTHRLATIHNVAGDRRRRRTQHCTWHKRDRYDRLKIVYTILWELSRRAHIVTRWRIK